MGNIRKRPTNISMKSESGLDRSYKKNITITQLAILFAGIVVLVLIGRLVFVHWCNAVWKTYEDSKVKNTLQARRDVAEHIYETAESKYHVMNQINTEINKVLDTTKLEVMSVYHCEYEIENGTTKAWLKIPGHAVYTLDLDQVEFVTDDGRNYVCALIPVPQCEFQGIDEQGVQQLFFKKNGLFDKSYREGVDLAEGQKKNGESKLKEYFETNANDMDKARDHAKEVITDIIRELNYGNTELIVEVDFIEV